MEAGGEAKLLAALCDALRPRLGAAGVYLAALEPPGPGETVLPGAALLDPATLAELLAVYARSLAARDDRAAASMWAQYLFSFVVAPPLAVACLTGRRMPGRLDALSIRLDTASRTPRGIVVGAPAEPKGETIFELLEDWVFATLVPLVTAIGVAGRLGERILWSNAGVAAVAILDGLAAAGEAAAAERGTAMIDTLVWPSSGRRNPLFRPYRPAAGRARVRRACCLRTALPGIERCDGCPDYFLAPVAPPPPRDG